MTLTEYIQPLLDKRFPFALVAILSIIGGANAVADEHLVPEEAPIAGQLDFQQDYNALVAASFARVYQRGITVRMIALPSFHPEYAVALEQNRILVLKPQVMLWSYPILGMMKSGQIKTAKNAFGKNAVADPKFEKDDDGIAELEARLPRDPRDVKIDVCERQIDSAIAKDIVGVWTDVTYRARYDMPVHDNEEMQTVTIHADADSYHFSVSDEAAGQIADPDPKSDPGRLLAVAKAMESYCEHPEKKNFAALSGAVDTLKAQLNPR